MRIVIAPDKFKGCLDAPGVAAAIADGVRQAVPDATVDLCPVADGGDGTVAALVAATGGRLHRCRVVGPLPEMRIDAAFGLLGDGQTAVVEMAAASGLALLKPDERDPAATTTFGTGQLMMEAARLGVRDIILGIGGSATIDGGIGCCHACDLPVILRDGEPLSPTEPLCGRDLDRVVLIKHGRGSLVERTRITVACDVRNPLCGPHGAAAVYGPQKGATPQQVEWFDGQLRALAERTGKMAEADMPGAGAAGGLGFALRAYFPNATLRPGVDIVFDALDLPRRLADADLCITGEGRLDASSLHGKAPLAVAALCRQMNVPCVAAVGSADAAAVASAGTLFRSVAQVQAAGMSHEDAIRQTAPRLQQIGSELARQILSRA